MSQNKPTRNKRRTVAQWQSLLSEQSRSGLSIKSFCAARGIGCSTFSNWKSRLANVRESSEQSTHFVELSPPAVAAVSDWDIELILGNDIVLRIARR